ncbi:MAG: CBS domain-containing protein [Bacteriovoracaceae bacterium]|nr:CBS domain-containing protein [Bacteriovoracaceae bacterium]
MSLMISRNGIIQEVTRKSLTKKVTPPDDNRVQFEDVLEKESGQQMPFNKEKGHPKKETLAESKGLKSYQKQSTQIHSKLVHARDICSRPIITAKPQDTIQMALEKMQKYKIHHLPLLDEAGTLVGIISDRDLLGKRTHERLDKVATKEVLVVKDSLEIKMVARLMLENHISALPLINEEEELTGMITKSNLLEYIMKSTPFDRHI